MLSLVLAVSLPVQVACTNCYGVGYFEITCPTCEGKGEIINPRGNSAWLKMPNGHYTNKWPCPTCFKGMVKVFAKGTGIKKVTCKVCHGKKKIRR